MLLPAIRMVPLTVLLTVSLAWTTNAHATEDSLVDETLPPRLPLNELRVFVEAFDRVSNAYVEEIDDRTLLENAIRGMLSQLDPHSAYLDRSSFSNLQEHTTGNYGGLGLEVDMEDGFIRVVSPMDDTPAARGGILPGDLIIKLDDKPVKGMSLSESIDLMRGEPGSEITISVLREGNSQPVDIVLVREVIQVPSVKERLLDDGFGYIRIAQFQNRTGEEVEKSLDKLTEEGKLLGLVIDLRNNPGGVLQSAVAVSDLFINDGLIVYTSGRMDNSELTFNSSGPDVTGNVPIVVLVNEGSASASEIVAGALQDHGRAVIMGINTFGKGSVQTILPLNNEKAIKLTTALYYTPNGRSIQAEGIVPDVWVDRSTVTRVKSNPFLVKESDLHNHLTNDTDESDPADDTDDLAETDYQLNEALTLLRGLNILAANRANGD
jgi:carboxyl-terminal processing protease